MADMLEQLVVPVVSSSVILGIFVFFLKRYLDKYLSAYFLQIEKNREIIFKSNIKTSEFVLDNQLGMYAEVSELVYRIRNAILRNVKKDNAYEWSPNFHELVGHLTENMYKYRLFLSEDVFEKLHEFKQIAQDGLVLHDTYTRPENVSDNTEYLKQREVYAVKSERVDSLHSEIIGFVQNKVVSLSGRNEI